MDIFKINNNEDECYLIKIDGELPHLGHRIDIPFEVWDEIDSLSRENYRAAQIFCRKYWSEHEEEAY